MKTSTLLVTTALLLGLATAAQATDMAKISPQPLGERSVFSDRATNERLAPVGHVCVQGQPCVAATSNSTAAATPAATGASGSGMTPKQVFDKHCAMCHKTGVAGAPVFGNADDWAPHIAKGADALYHSAINGFKAMPPRGMCSECSDAEIKATVRYMVNHSGGDFAAPAKTQESKPTSDNSSQPADVAKETTPSSANLKVAASGLSPEKVFNSHCSMCHKTGVAGAPLFGNADDWAPHIAKGKETLYHSAINGFKAMPPRGMCTKCSDADLKATVDYMVEHSGGW